jgi:hypothetical protein
MDLYELEKFRNANKFTYYNKPNTANMYNESKSGLYYYHSKYVEPAQISIGVLTIDPPPEDYNINRLPLPFRPVLPILKDIKCQKMYLQQASG